MRKSIVQKKENISIETKGKTTKDKVENTYTDELIIGICSPIGSLRAIVIESIKKRLETGYKYKVEIIKLSDFITRYYENQTVNEIGKTIDFSQLMHKINGGDHLRKKYNNNSILVELAIKRIREDREKILTTEIKGQRNCYIIDSLKNIEELKLLRAVYRDIFYLFSVFSPEDERQKALINKGLSKPEAKQLISTDEFEDILHGQNVRNTFIEADFFVRISQRNKNEIDKKVKKYLHLIFNTDIITPDYNETAMYHAKSAAGNSACLSRQVGATITDKNGISIARGWNDVAKCGGNLYRDTDNNPQRCKDLGYCSNITYNDEIVNEINSEIEQLFNRSTSRNKLKKNAKENAILSGIKDIVKKSRFRNIIEYSRAIHAEMHAIIIGSQLTGNKMIDGNLYCTTYPCHNCARHIVLAGIKNIYYIEPYKKSLGMLLHKDSLTENENEITKVRILPYDGVAPRKYLDFFSMNNSSRKMEDGKIKKIDLEAAVPKIRLSLQAIPELENQAIHSLYECGLINEDYEK